MFSTTQLEVIRSHVPLMREQGYLYYLAVDLRYNNGSLPLPDGLNLYIYYSKEPIVYNQDYVYRLTGDCVGYGFNTDSASIHNTSARIYNEFVSADYANFTIESLEEDYMWYSTNAVPGEDAASWGATLVPPDFTYTEVRQTDVSSGLLFIACVFIFFYSFLKLFRR